MRYEQTIEFRCAVQDLWRQLVDVELVSQWMYNGAVELVTDRPGPLDLGMTGSLRAKRMAERMGQWQVTAFEPNRYLEVTMVLSTPGMVGKETRAEFILEEGLGTTRLTYVNDAELGCVGNCLGRLLGRFWTLRGFRRLRRAVEADAPAT